jgi:geranylgeranyl reductase family protein
MKPQTTYDAVIVGAGPSGSLAAFDLARAGAKVALVERAVMPRYKTCGGGIVSRAVKLLPYDISNVIDRECKEAELNLADARMRFSVKRDYPLVSMTMRENLDYLMFQSASNAGARVMDGCRVTAVRPENGHMEIVTEKEVLTSRFVIGADGAQSIVARTGGWQKRLQFAPLLEWEVTVKEDLFQQFSHSARFEFGPVPAGYAWVFPKKNHLSIGLGGYTTGKIDLKDRLRAFLKDHGLLGGAERIERHGYFIPVSPRGEGFMKGRVLLAGDAAGFVDPVTGEGITYALLSGKSAAAALLEGDFDPNDVRKAYLEQLKGGVLSELRWGKLLGALLYRSSTVRTFVFRQYGDQLTQAFADIISGATTYASLCKKHIGLRRLFKTLNGLHLKNTFWD